MDEGGFTAAEALIHGVKHGLIAMGASLVGVVAGLAASAVSTANQAKQIDLLSQRTGIGTKTLQELTYAADRSGVSAEEMAMGLAHLAKTGVKDVGAETARLAEQFSHMKDGGEKTALAMAKFGRAGARLIPLLNGGKEKLAEFAAEANDTGNVLDETQIKAGVELKEALERLAGAFKGLRVASTPLLKAFTAIVRKAGDMVIAFRHWIKEGDHMSLLFRGLAIAAVSTALAVTLLGSSMVGSAVAAIAAWVAAAAPFILLALFIGLVGLALEDIWGFFTGKDSLIGEIIGRWTDKVDGFKKAWEGMLHPLREWEAFWNAPDLHPEKSFGGYISSLLPGGAASPGAAASGGAGMGGPTVKTEIHIHPTPGMSPQEIADATAERFDVSLQGILNQAYATAEGK